MAMTSVSQVNQLDRCCGIWETGEGGSCPAFSLNLVSKKDEIKTSSQHFMFNFSDIDGSTKHISIKVLLNTRFSKAACGPCTFSYTSGLCTF